MSLSCRIKMFGSERSTVQPLLANTPRGATHTDGHRLLNGGTGGCAHVLIRDNDPQRHGALHKPLSTPHSAAKEGRAESKLQ